MEQPLDIVNNFKNPKILIVGDLMLDEYIWGDVNRISPEAPIPVLDTKEITYVPGGAANAAHNARALGDKVTLVGVIGPEDKGKLLKKILEGKGIDTEGIFVDENRKTTVKTRVVAKNQQVVRIDSEDKEPISQELENKILEFIKEKIKEVNCIIISDYVKGTVTESLAKNIISLTRENNILCLVDSKRDDYLRYKNCCIITPNERELARALKLEINNESQFFQAGRMLLSHVACDNILIKQGARGMTLFRKEGDTFHCPALNKKAIDVSGAGDTAIASFALSLAAGADFKQAIIIASYACAIAVGKMGTAVVLPEELIASLKNDFSNERKEA